MPMLLTRQEMEQKLIRVFPPEQTTGLVEVLDTFREMEIERAADTRELKQGLAALIEEVKKLAEGQRQLFEGQRQLFEGQRRLDDRVAELAVAMAALAEAQRRTETRLDNLSAEVGSLANTFGFRLEEFVAALLPPYLERHYGIADLSLQRRYFDLGGGQLEEVDLVGEGRRDGQTVTALVECRATVGGSETGRLADKLDAVAGLLGTREMVKVIVAMNIHPSAEPAAAERGVWLIPYSRINRERG